MAGLMQGFKAKTSTIVLLLLNIGVWGSLSVAGYFGMKEVSQQNAIGYPNAGQIHYYFYMPLLVLLISVLWPLGFWRVAAWIRNIVPIAALIFCPLYLFFYTGGM